jgi:flavorubredoxin
MSAPTPRNTPTLAPYRIAPDTWIVPQIEPAGPGQFVSVNSMVITGAEPVLVDTGTAINRTRWLEHTFSIVDPADVRWVFVSHADRDHIGNLDAVLDTCPHATVVTSYVGVIYMLADGPPALDRLRWVNDGETLHVGDRTLALVTPPLWDAAETRGMFDPTTGVYWAADCFGSMLTHPVTDAAQLDRDFWRESVLRQMRVHAPWHSLLDPAKYDAHVARSARLSPAVVASAHGPVLAGPMVKEGFGLIRQAARMDPVEPMGQDVLDILVAAIAAMAPPSESAA